MNKVLKNTGAVVSVPTPCDASVKYRGVASLADAIRSAVSARCAELDNNIRVGSKTCRGEVHHGRGNQYLFATGSVPGGGRLASATLHVWLGESFQDERYGCVVVFHKGSKLPLFADIVLPVGLDSSVLQSDFNACVDAIIAHLVERGCGWKLSKRRVSCDE